MTSEVTSFDLEAAIRAFAQDSDASATLELPATLTTEQRKEAKTIVEQYPDLKCESYGWKQDRRLHVFKKSSEVKVKNTFIDGWADEAKSGEHPVFRSVPSSMQQMLPRNLLERTLQRCLEHEPGPESSPSSSSAVELPPLPEGFQIRNTFIHIESVPTVERIIQSMPHGMFRQCLEEELTAQETQGETGSQTARSEPTATERTEGSPSSTAVVSAYDDDHQALCPGTEVIIQNLTKLPEFNGLTGVVQSLDPESGRYDVLLDGPAGQCGWRWVKVKGENCRPCMPPPPRNAPTLSMDCHEPAPEDVCKGIPPTPQWDDDFQCQAGIAADLKNATTLKLNALV